MIRFADVMQTAWPEVLGSWLLLLIWGGLLLFTIDMKEKRLLPLILRNALYLFVVAVSYTMFQCITGIQSQTVTNQFFSGILLEFEELPFVMIVLICLLLSANEIWMLILSVSWSRSHITDSSIKEAVDTLPSGIICYDELGFVRFKNVAMEDICLKLTGDILYSGTDFEKAVFESEAGEGFSTYTSEDQRIWIMPDLSVWSFSKSLVSDGKRLLSMISASDISEEYGKTRELAKKRKSMEELNEKLSQYNDDILSIISAKETLNAKIKIHDELGAGLLSIKKCLKSGGSPDEKETLINRISVSMDYLRTESLPVRTDEYELMINTAKELGVFVEVTGILPSTEPEKHIVATAIHECFTNTLRHAGGNLLKINVNELPDSVSVSFTNNGQCPDSVPKETGGLRSLRTLTEKAGGSMNISIEDGFLLTLTLRKGGFEDAL